MVKMKSTVQETGVPKLNFIVLKIKDVFKKLKFVTEFEIVLLEKMKQTVNAMKLNLDANMEGDVFYPVKFVMVFMIVLIIRMNGIVLFHLIMDQFVQGIYFDLCLPTLWQGMERVNQNIITFGSITRLDMRSPRCGWAEGCVKIN